MKRPSGFLAHPPKRRRSVSFNTTLSVVQSEIAKAAEELAKLAPDDGEVTFRLRAELRLKRGVEKESLTIQANWSVEAIEDGRR